MAALRSKRIEVVIGLAERAEDEAALRLQAQQQALVDEKLRLSQLREYYQSYEQQFGGRTGGLRASSLANSRLFLQQLAQAIKSQELQVGNVEGQLRQAQAAWHKCHMKHQSLIDLQQRYRREEQELQDRKEQARLDEWVSQRASVTSVDE